MNKQDNKQRLFEVMGRLDKSFGHKLNEDINNIDPKENLEYFLSFNNDDVYWKWINGEIDDNGAIEVLRDIDGVSYNPDVDYKKEYSSTNENADSNTADTNRDDVLSFQELFLMNKMIEKIKSRFNTELTDENINNLKDVLCKSFESGLRGNNLKSTDVSDTGNLF